MTGTGRARGSVAWRLALRVMYRFLRLLDPLIRSGLSVGVGGLDGVVEVRVAGRRSGKDRSTLITLLHVDGNWYIGHPNGDTGWTRNAEAAGIVKIDPPAAGGDTFSVVRLPPGPERDAVIQGDPYPAAVPRQPGLSRREPSHRRGRRVLSAGSGSRQRLSGLGDGLWHVGRRRINTCPAMPLVAYSAERRSTLWPGVMQPTALPGEASDVRGAPARDCA